MYRIYNAMTGRLLGHLDIDGHPADSVGELLWEMTGESGWEMVRWDGFDSVWVEQR